MENDDDDDEDDGAKNKKKNKIKNVSKESEIDERGFYAYANI